MFSNSTVRNCSISCKKIWTNLNWFRQTFGSELTIQMVNAYNMVTLGVCYTQYNIMLWNLSQTTSWSIQRSPSVASDLSQVCRQYFTMLLSLGSVGNVSSTVTSNIIKLTEKPRIVILISYLLLYPGEETKSCLENWCLTKEYIGCAVGHCRVLEWQVCDESRQSCIFSLIVWLQKKSRELNLCRKGKYQYINTDLKKKLGGSWKVRREDSSHGQSWYIKWGKALPSWLGCGLTQPDWGDVLHSGQLLGQGTHPGAFFQLHLFLVQESKEITLKY